jgi:hypothetical protein
MSGPLPKDPAVRQRRNKSATRAILAADAFADRGRPRLPVLPDGEKWHPISRMFWRIIWSSPVSAQYQRADFPGLLRLVSLIDTYWKTRKIDAAKEIRLLEREFGLTPLSRRRLEWTVVQTEEAIDRREANRIKRAKMIDVDPRGVLEE